MLTAHKVMGGSGKDESNIWKYGDRNNAQLQASINASELMQKMKEAERKLTAAELENERTRKKCEDQFGWNIRAKRKIATEHGSER